MKNAKEEPDLSLLVPVNNESQAVDPCLAHTGEVLGGYFARLSDDVKERPVYTVERACGEANGKGGASSNEQPQRP